MNRETGQRLLEAHSLAALGRHEAALGYFETSFSIRRQIDDRRGEGWMLHRWRGCER